MKIHTLYPDIDRFDYFFRKQLYFPQRVIVDPSTQRSACSIFDIHNVGKKNQADKTSELPYQIYSFGFYMYFMAFLQEGGTGQP